MVKSELEETLAFQIKALKLPDPEREYQFCPPRKFRFDFAWPAEKLAVECEGGIWGYRKGIPGAHTRGAHFESDCDKYNIAVLGGWKVLRFTGKDIKSGKAMDLIGVMLRK